jgi:c-di-GMP-binding flagellar brake protein YcgR
VKERRRHFRIQALHPIFYYEDIRPRPRSGSTMDLSLEGVAIETRYPVNKGELLEMSVVLSSRLITFSGKVIYFRRLKGKRFRAGIRFEKISEECRHRLEEHLSQIREKRCSLGSLA